MLRSPQIFRPFLFSKVKPVERHQRISVQTWRSTFWANSSLFSTPCIASSHRPQLYLLFRLCLRLASDRCMPSEPLACPIQDSCMSFSCLPTPFKQCSPWSGQRQANLESLLQGSLECRHELRCRAYRWSHPLQLYLV